MWSAGPAPRPLGGFRSGALQVRLGLSAGMRIGLFGGSFDPAHEGHAHVAETALKRLGLDRVIWLVSPGNPLKPRAPAELARRMASARAFAKGPRMVVSDAESRLGVRYTIDTIRALKARSPGVCFVWIMGADSLEGLPHCDWVLIDAGDVIIHLFRPEVRAFYNIEKIWSVEPPKPAAAH